MSRIEPLESGLLPDDGSLAHGQHRTPSGSFWGVAVGTLHAGSLTTRTWWRRAEPCPAPAVGGQLCSQVTLNAVPLGDKAEGFALTTPELVFIVISV